MSGWTLNSFLFPFFFENAKCLKFDDGKSNQVDPRSQIYDFKPQPRNLMWKKNKIICDSET